MNIDIPPEEDGENEESGSGSRFVPWLIIVAIALLFVPLYFGSSTIEDSISPLATELIILQTTLTAPPLVPVAEQTLSVRLIDSRAQLNGIASIPSTLVAGHVDWPGIMTTLLQYDANQIRQMGFTNETTHLTLNGEAIQEGSVLDYVANLQRSGFFSQVRVQSISLSVVPSPTPNLEASGSGDGPLSPIYMPFVFTLSIDLAGANDGSQ